MTEPGEMDERVTALEGSVSDLRARVRRAEEDAGAARHLASGADRYTAELRVELREFRAEMRGFRDGNNRVLTAMRADLGDLGTEVHTVHGKIDRVAAGLQYLTDLLAHREREDPPAP